MIEHIFRGERELGLELFAICMEISCFAYTCMPFCCFDPQKTEMGLILLENISHYS